MGKYEHLLHQFNHITVEDKFELPGEFKGFLDNDVILIDKNLSTYHKHEVLAEEIAHYKITYGNIIDQSNMLNHKLELKARRLAYESVITLQGLIDAFEFGVHNLHEMSLFLKLQKVLCKSVLSITKINMGYKLNMVIISLDLSH